MDVEEKLVWLGIKTNAAKVNELAADVQQLQETVGDWGTWKAKVQDDLTSYAELETYLLNQGWSQEDVDAFIARLQNTYADFTAFQNDLDNYDSYEAWQSNFESTTGVQGDATTDSGQPAAGIRVHESAGVSYSGVSVPPGTTEVFGNRIEFSQQDPPRGTQDPVTYSNFTSDDPDDVEVVNSAIVFSADVTNPNGWRVTVTVPLTEDGSVLQSKEVTIDANSTTSVSFSVTKSDYICADYAIGNTSTILACWVPAGLVI
ncbi:hypothetical protein M197_gp52 [Haloarcula hispanica tailed virus 2]|uniref:Uncharacterized protein n=1 Tax=Haloarcula hispanica tailed virus 2 TaxID=1273751 RepID=R4TKL6_9CAUD|nr:hypothetical protein M197_gp52 [Haloarcula hispanica tailed virus 2]AGM11217.1 hypothetical protein HHTV2_52 [Haloarcula hispanica tailed virus 2]